MSAEARDVVRSFTEGLALGVTLGAVSNIEDPKGLGRIKVKLRLKGQEVETDWAPIASLLAGPSYGAFMLPKLQDTALVAFADGDASQPFVLGFLWNGAQLPPVPQQQQANVRLLKTQRGKVLSFDDAPQGGKLTLSDEKQNRFEIDTDTNKLSIVSNGDLSITANGQLTLQAAGVTLRNTAGNVSAQLTAENMQLEGGASMRLQATMIDLN